MLLTVSGVLCPAYNNFISGVADKVTVAEVALDKLLSRRELADEERVVVFYRAPWAISDVANDQLTLPDTGEELNLWLKFHRALLRKRRSWGAKIFVVHADNIDLREFAMFLDIEPDIPFVACSCDELTSDIAVLERFLFGLFESAAPEYVDVFEALEALPWRHSLSIHGALDRSELAMPELVSIVHRIKTPQYFPALRLAYDKLVNKELRLVRDLALDRKALSDANAKLADALESFDLERRELSTRGVDKAVALNACEDELLTTRLSLSYVEESLSASREENAALHLRLDEMCQQVESLTNKLNYVDIGTDAGEPLNRKVVGLLKDVFLARQESSQLFEESHNFLIELNASADAMNRARGLIARLIA